MAYFTPEEVLPSPSTIALIRQIAHSYRVIKIGNKMVGVCVN